MRIIIFLTAFILGSLNLNAQFDKGKKMLQATRTDDLIKVDGILNEPIWDDNRNNEVATQFIQNNPLPGEQSCQATKVRLAYDNKAIYIGARLLDSHPDSILKELTQRDVIGNTDYFGIVIDSYKDGNNGFGFVVTASGVQVDIKYSSQSGTDLFDGDINWNAIWESAVQQNENGWVVEMKIPYSALRFPSVQKQEWHVNFARQIRRSRELSYWNGVNPAQTGLLPQSGLLTDISDIKSPVRLSATPFLALFLENNFDKTVDPISQYSRGISGGMDVKYGINDAFTLDMTLIPDFSQAQSDNNVLNLSPFEIQFDENRQFFTEGTELFNKADLFYSRRIGNQPLRFYEIEDELEDGEEIINNPTNNQLINATKISGRSNRGLGVGFFNANTSPTKATVRDYDGNQREIESNPLSNYNVIVLDQNLKNNSFVSLINTNVWRSGHTYDANVTGGMFSFQDKQNKYRVSGKAALSQLYYPSEVTSLGQQFNLGLDKISGRSNFGVSLSEISDDFDINDLGFLRFNNNRSFSGYYSFTQYQPFGAFNGAGGNLGIEYSMLSKPNVYRNFGINYSSYFITKKFFAFGFWGYFNPSNPHDYFEPRTNDFSRYFKRPKTYDNGVWISSDYRKKFALDVRVNYYHLEYDIYGYTFFVSPRFRASDKLNFILNVSYDHFVRDRGFASAIEDVDNFNVLKEDDILFSSRSQQVFSNTFTAKYNFNNKMGVSLRARHYWTQVDYHKFFTLNDDGTLLPSDYNGLDRDGNNLHQTTVNFFNIDMIYNWRFAPGSDIFLVWKNAIFTNEDNIENSYLKSLGRLPQSAQNNNLSLKIIYYLDYLQFQKN